MPILLIATGAIRSVKLQTFRAYYLVQKKPLSESDRGFLSWIAIGFRALSP